MVLPLVLVHVYPEMPVLTANVPVCGFVFEFATIVAELPPRRNSVTAPTLALLTSTIPEKAGKLSVAAFTYDANVPLRSAMGWVLAPPTNTMEFAVMVICV